MHFWRGGFSVKKKKELSLQDKLIALAIALAAAVAFAYIVISPYGIYFKLILAFADLTVSGLALKKITGWEGYYGILLARGKEGFSAMHWFAKKFPGFSRRAADFGLTLCFGLFYGWYVFGKNRRKFVLHALLLLLFFLGLVGVLSGFAFGSLALQQYVVLALFLALGLLAVGFFSLVLQAYAIFTTPTAAPGVGPAIPGLGFIPASVFAEWAIAIVIIAIVHEVAHGILSIVERLELKSSGVLLWGFLPIGAFVEPDEEKFKRKPIQARRRILVAGSSSNIFFFVVFSVINLE